MRSDNRAIEYYPNGEDEPAWKIEHWDELSQVFDLQVSDLKDWHQCLAGQGRPWTVIRKIHRVNASFGEGMDIELFESWDWKKLSAKEGVSEKVLRNDLDAAAAHWKKVRNSLSLRRSVETAVASGVAVKGLDVDGLPEFRAMEEMDDERVKRCLEAFRMNNITGDADRLCAARRALELRKYLDERSTREQARQMIYMEISLGMYEDGMMAMKSRMAKLRETQNPRKEEAEEVARLLKDIKAAEEAQTALAESHRKVALALGEDEQDEAQNKRAALGTASFWVEASREWHRDGTKKLVDGIFTADELVWLTEGLSFRDPQYRPDIVVRLKDAMSPENLWASDYEPRNVEREAARRLHAIVKAMGGDDEPVEIESIDRKLESDEDIEPGLFREDEPEELAAGSVQPRVLPVVQESYSDCMAGG
jgi:hypothetical protein